MQKYFVYILLSKKDKNLYVGCTPNIKERIEKHNKGYSISTKNRRPLILIHTEEFLKKEDAFSRERFLKSLWGGRFKKKVLTKY
ncbi:MAG: GIY-YIG nuclease family protein, partial [Candidatus Pacebacteria bacterium]|nr:GIY-YIG nuclease family protein [Candidatus Paceibacterota bacterium]